MADAIKKEKSKIVLTSGKRCSIIHKHFGRGKSRPGAAGSENRAGIKNRLKSKKTA
ncbi:MAG: hypothetical protein PUA83_01830 [Clostridiales bacterium]|nr:hypothetical protein [Clostridiales bacterium]